VTARQRRRQSRRRVISNYRYGYAQAEVMKGVVSYGGGRGDRTSNERRGQAEAAWQLSISIA